MLYLIFLSQYHLALKSSQMWQIEKYKYLKNVAQVGYIGSKSKITDR